MCAPARRARRAHDRCAAPARPAAPARAVAIVLGFGGFFSVLTVILTWMETKFSGVKITSEHFNTAGRDVKTGLTASVIVSQWTWAATLLQSSNVAWNYGITGPFWYASGATVQILLFGILAIEIKRRAPNAHTFAELVRVRWGTVRVAESPDACTHTHTLREQRANAAASMRRTKRAPLATAYAHVPPLPRGPSRRPHLVLRWGRAGIA